MIMNADTGKMISMKEYIEFVKVNPEMKKDTEEKLNMDLELNREMTGIIQKELQQLRVDKINLLNKLTLLRN
jgi:hypothetical protein